MRTPVLLPALALGGLALAFATLPTSATPQGSGDWTVTAWNDLGMHCLDSDYQVFSILPPYNTICAHVVDSAGHLVTNDAGVEVTYRGVADPSGSTNLTSAGKTDFWSKVGELYGATPPVDEGLAGKRMPGLANTPQPMDFDPALDWFRAEGIPITPIDDAGARNHYPMMRVEARDSGGALRGWTDIVLPVSDEMDCRACHATGAGPAAEPVGGWVADGDFDRDYRLNILRLHDERESANPDYATALGAFGFDPSGLEATVTQQGRSVLCSACHGSNALPGTGFGTIAPLTQVMHGYHASVVDPINGMTLDASDNRSSCYRCHPGSETLCLRGAMGRAVAPDGSLAMQCQSCHGDMSAVGDPARQGWFEEPACQSCHTGDALLNNGQIRYTSVFVSPGVERVAVNPKFATNPNTPLAALDMYRFSKGHGDLQCSNCHGSTHAIFPSAEPNDNVQSFLVQGHEGTIADCTACHASMPSTSTGGPHGMHRIGNVWIDKHPDVVESGGAAACRACHGTDYRGTELSRMFGARNLSTKYGTKSWWEGYEVGCYDCHKGPSNNDGNPNKPPVAQAASASTPAGTPVAIPLLATDPGDTIVGHRIVSQPAHGTVALTGSTATYHPFPGFAGSDAFTFAADDGDAESNLADVFVTVTAGSEVFGSGLAGTAGVPALTVDAPPALGSTVNVTLGNSLGSATPGLLLLGTQPFYQPTVWDGTLLVKGPAILALGLPAAGLTVPYGVPNGASWVGYNMVGQLAVIDPGASAGVAFSPGLRLVFGQ